MFMLLVPCVAQNLKNCIMQIILQDAYKNQTDQNTWLFCPAPSCSYPWNLIIQTSSTLAFDYITGGLLFQYVVLYLFGVCFFRDAVIVCAN